LAEGLPHPHAVDRQHPTEVRLDKGADRKAAEALGQNSRCGADAAFEPECGRPRSCAHRSLWHRAVLSLLDGEEDIEGPDCTGPDVIQVAIVGLTNNRVDRTNVLISRLAQGPIHYRLHRRTHAQRIGQHDRRLEVAQLLHLQEARRLAESVGGKDRRRHLPLKNIAAVGHDRGDTGADPLALDQGAMAHPDALDIGDRVERSRMEDPGLDAEITHPWAIDLLTKTWEAADQAENGNNSWQHGNSPKILF